MLHLRIGKMHDFLIQATAQRTSHTGSHFGCQIGYKNSAGHHNCSQTSHLQSFFPQIGCLDLCQVQTGCFIAGCRIGCFAGRDHGISHGIHHFLHGIPHGKHCILIHLPALDHCFKHRTDIHTGYRLCTSILLFHFFF